MNNLRDLQSSCISADNLVDFGELFDEGIDYVRLCDVEELISNIETETDFALEEINKVLKRCQ